MSCDADPLFTELSLNPPVASTEQTVQVKWQVGVDVHWDPNGSDELRVFNTAGVLHCVRQLWACEPLGEGGSYLRGAGTVVAPAVQGAYVVSLYDFAARRRIFSSTFRVAGSKVGLPISIDVKQAETLPHGCIDVSYDPRSLHGGFLALFKLAHPDNNGLTSGNESPLGCALVAVRAPTPDLVEGLDSTSLGFVAPQQTGQYQVRYLKTCRTDVLRSVALSNTFTVRGAAAEESVASQAVKGALRLPGVPDSGVKVGDLIVVEWDITEGCAVISELDCIFLYPFGRPEAVRQTDEITTVATAPMSKWRAELQAPCDAGRYAIGYFSHRLQKFVLDGPSVLVVGERASLTVDVGTIVTEVGSVVRLSWTLDEIVHRQEDRCLVYDLGMNLYGSVPICGGDGFEPRDPTEPLSQAHEVLFSRQRRGCLELCIDRPGRYLAVFYSSLLRKVVAKTEPFRVTATPGVGYYSRNLDIALCCRKRQAPTLGVSVRYCVGMDGGVAPPDGTASRDCIGIYAAGERDCVASHEFGSSHEIPALHLFWLDGMLEDTVVFPAIQQAGHYEARYLTPTSLGRLSCVMQCSFEVVCEAELAGTPSSSGAAAQGWTSWLLESFDHIPILELAQAVLTLPDDDGEGVLVKTGQQQQQQGTNQRRQGPSPAEGDDPKSPLSPMTPDGGSKRVRASSVILHYFPTPEFRGAVMVPRSVALGEAVVVTYHVLHGQPIPTDKVVIVDEQCSTCFAEASLGEASLGREDYTLGTVLLKPPRSHGLYMAAYYSAARRSLVATSPLFRVLKSKSAEPGEQQRGGGGGRVGSVGGGGGASPRDGGGAFGRSASRKSTLSRSVYRESRFRALLVGAQCGGSAFPVRGASNDVALLRACLLEHFPGAVPESILCLSDAEGAGDPSRMPNALNIRQGMQWLLEDCRPKDQILFYFAGLGSRVNSYGSTELDGYDCCLLPSDYDWRERVITFAELRNELYLAAPRGTKVTVILDCCFSSNTMDVAVQRGLFDEDEVSGTAVHCAAQRLKDMRGKKGWGDRVVARCLVPPQGTFHGYFRPKERGVAASPEWCLEMGGLHGLLRQVDSSAEHEVRNDNYGEGVEVHSGMWLLQACSPSSMAFEKFLDGKYRGLFTWALVQSIGSLKDSTTPANPLWYKAVMYRVQQELAQWKFGQTPRLCVSEPDDVYEAFLAQEA